VGARYTWVAHFPRVGVAKRVAFSLFWRTLFVAIILVELTGVKICVDDSNGSPIDVHVATNLEIVRAEETSVWPWESMPSDQRALWDSAVVLLFLRDNASVILQEIQDDALARSPVLQIGLNDTLLEVPVEPKHMPIQCVPCRHLFVRGRSGLR